MNAVFSVEGMRLFGANDAKVLGWEHYCDAPIGFCETVLIEGMYDAPHYEWTLANTKFADRRIIKWCGSDVLALTRPELLPEATHLCDSENLRRRLMAHGIDAAVVACATPLHPEVTPLPDIPTVGVYFGSAAENYGASYVRFLMDALPEARWITYGAGQFSPEQMHEVVASCTATIRLTANDGSACTLREYMEAGRYALGTVEAPFVKQVSLNDPVGMVKALRHAIRQTEPDLDAAAHYRDFNSTERFLREFKEATNV